MQRVARLVAAVALLGCGGGGGNGMPASPGAGGTEGGTGGMTGASGTGGATASGTGGAPATACPGAGTPRTLRVYVAGESIEERNRFVEPPFACDGRLNERGGAADRNDNEEYGWMVPFAARLALRAPGLTVEFVGASPWSGADDNAYSGS